MAEEQQSWPELVGMSGNAAKAKLQSGHPSLAIIELVPEGSFVTEDYRTDRVRIWIDGTTQTVTVPPTVG